MRGIRCNQTLYLDQSRGTAAQTLHFADWQQICWCVLCAPEERSAMHCFCEDCEYCNDWECLSCLCIFFALRS